jgi:hypothetical protein
MLAKHHIATFEVGTGPMPRRIHAIRTGLPQTQPYHLGNIAADNSVSGIVRRVEITVAICSSRTILRVAIAHRLRQLSLDGVRLRI